MSQWYHLDSQPAPHFVDSSGAGDWCTTGLLIGLLGKNRNLRRWLSKNEVISALQYGQVLAAISCSFVGSQGLIYADNKKENINNIFSYLKSEAIKKIKPASLSNENTDGLCRTCLQSI